MVNNTPTTRTRRARPPSRRRSTCCRVPALTRCDESATRSSESRICTPFLWRCMGWGLVDREYSFAL